MYEPPYLQHKEVGKYIFELLALNSRHGRSILNRPRLEEMFNTVVVSFVGMLGIFFAVLINDDIPERLDNYEILGATPQSPAPRRDATRIHSPHRL